ncbi:MAG: hypothetical protein ACPG4T_01160 [Nannocystaceae bacterium]
MATHICRLSLVSVCLVGCAGDEGPGTSDSGNPPTGTSSTHETGTSGDPSTGETGPESTGSGSSGGPTDTSTGPTPETETEGEAVCNNAIVEGDEECDNGQLSFDGPCLPGCILNVCGDGFQNLEQEDCDKGEQNGAYGTMCDVNCQLDDAMFCGDGVVQEEYEQCEPGEVHDEFDLDCIECAWEGFRLVFVSSVTFDGSLQGGGLPSPNDNATGVALADFRCQQLADNEGLDGTFHAWLSDNNGTNKSNAATRIIGADTNTSYRMPNGILVANSWAELLAEGPSNPITYREDGMPLDENLSRVWSNTGPNGQSLTANTCGSWTQDMNNSIGHTGALVVGPNWTDSGIELSCQKNYPIYCFQGEE